MSSVNGELGYNIKDDELREKFLLAAEIIGKENPDRRITKTNWIQLSIFMACHTSREQLMKRLGVTYEAG